MSEEQAVLQSDEITGFLTHIRKNLSHIKDAESKYVSLLSALVYKDVQRHFEEEKGPDGAWTPWSAVYRKAMERAGRGANKLLQYSGKLKNSFQPTDYKTGPAGILWVNRAVTSRGFPYAWWHNDGAEEARGDKRRFMWVSEDATNQMSEVTLQFLLENAT